MIVECMCSKGAPNSLRGVGAGGVALGHSQEGERGAGQQGGGPAQPAHAGARPPAPGQQQLCTHVQRDVCWVVAEQLVHVAHVMLVHADAAPVTLQQFTPPSLQDASSQEAYAQTARMTVATGSASRKQCV